MGLDSYKNNLISNICKNFGSAQATCSSGSIHDFRVGIKRLRALINVFADINGGFKVKQYERRIRPIFKAAGGVRDLQVTEDLIWSWAVNSSTQVSEYYNHLKEKEIKAKEKFFRVSRGNKTEIFSELSGAISNELAGLDQQYIERHVGRATAASLLRIADKKKSGPLPFEELHKLRIEAKEARYRLQTLSAIQNENGLLKETDNWLRDIHRAIGLWHDMVVAQEKLDAFLKNEAVTPLFWPPAYDELMNELKRRAEESYQQFIESWEDTENVLSKSIEQLQRYSV